MKKNFVVNLLSKILSYPIILLLSMYVAHIIGVEKKGVIAAILVNIVVINVLTSSGFYASILYHLNAESDLEKKKLIIGQAFIYNIAHFLLVFILNIIFINAILDSVELNKMAVSLAASCQVFPLLCFKIIRSEDNFILLNALNILNQILPSFLLLIFWRITHDLHPYLLGLIISALTTLFLTVYIFRINLWKVKFNFIMLHKLFRYGLKGWAGDISALANVRIDQLALSQLVSPQYLGLYSVGTTLAELSWILVDSFSIVFVNRLFSYKSNVLFRKTLVYGIVFLGLSALSGCAVYFFAKLLLIPYGYGSEYLLSMNVYINLIFGIVIYAFAKILTKYFIAIGKLEIVSKFQMFAAFVTLVAVLSTAYLGYGYLEIAIASSIGYILSTLYITFMFFKYKDFYRQSNV